MGQLKLHHSQPSLDNSDLTLLSEVLSSKYIAKGIKTKEFEEALSERFQRTHAIFVSSGMAALHLSLVALGIKNGDQVTLPSYVCTALLNATHLCQAKPDIVDTTHQDFLLDPKLKFLSSQSKAIIYPQLFGAQTDIEEVPQCPIIEDCAMSLGPNALKQGSLAITSFYATKMITTGQGGAILTDDDSLAEEVRDLINYDNRENYRLRFNYAPTDIAAALGLSQLKKLDQLLEKRRQITLYYDKKLQELLSPNGLGQDYPGLFRYWIRSEEKNALIEYLSQHNIEAKAPVFKPLHQYLSLKDIDFPHSTKAFNTFVSIPFYPDLKEQDIDRVVEKIASFKG